MVVTTVLQQPRMHSGLNAIHSSGCARNGKNLRIPQGNVELVNECPHGPDIQKHNNKESALMKTIVGIEVLWS